MVRNTAHSKGSPSFILTGVLTLFSAIILSIALGPEHNRFVNRPRILQISGVMFFQATIVRPLLSPNV